MAVIVDREKEVGTGRVSNVHPCLEVFGKPARVATPFIAGVNGTVGVTGEDRLEPRVA